MTLISSASNTAEGLLRRSAFRSGHTRCELRTGSLPRYRLETRHHTNVEHPTAKRGWSPLGCVRVRWSIRRMPRCDRAQPALEAASSLAVLRRAVGLGFHDRGASERNVEKHGQAHEVPTTPAAPSAVLVVDYLDLRGLGSPVALAEAARSALLIRPFTNTERAPERAHRISPDDRRNARRSAHTRSRRFTLVSPVLARSGQGARRRSGRPWMHTTGADPAIGSGSTGIRLKSHACVLVDSSFPQQFLRVGSRGETRRRQDHESTGHRGARGAVAPVLQRR